MKLSRPPQSPQSAHFLAVLHFRHLCLREEVIVANMKGVYKATPHYRNSTKAKFMFFPRHPSEKTGTFTAIEITRCHQSLAAALEKMPYKVVPVSFLGECIKTVDDFFSNKLSKGVSQANVCQHCMTDAINGCGLQTSNSCFERRRPPNSQEPWPHRRPTCPPRARPPATASDHHRVNHI